MNNIIYNNEVIAIAGREGIDPGCSPTDKAFEMFGTEYGLFLPVTQSGYQFIRWVRRGMVDEVPKRDFLSYLIHVSNDGEVLLVHLDSSDDIISMIPYHSQRFALMNVSRDIAEAFTHLIDGCKTIAEAAQFIEDHQPEGMYQPTLIFVADYVKYAKEKGLTKAFLKTRF